MITSLNYITDIILRNKDISQVYLREYSYPAQKIGTEPALMDKIYQFSREDFLKSNLLKELIINLRFNRNIGFESKVKTLTGYRHIPMVDCTLRKSTKSLTLIKKVWKNKLLELGGQGGIFETDNSYHFIGNSKLLNQKDYVNFLCWCLLAVDYDKSGTPKAIVDVQYIAYCILKQSACLRISKYPKSRIFPHLIGEIN